VKDDPRFGDYTYQLAAATGRTGKGDQILGRLAIFQGTRIMFSHPILSILLNLLQQISLIWGKDDILIPSRYGPIIDPIPAFV